jgi:hypothetical protein
MNKVIYAVLELLDGQEIDVTFAADTAALLKRDVEKALQKLNVPLHDVYEIEMVRPFE